MSSLKMSGGIYIGVRNLEAAVAWYKEKLVLRPSSEPVDEEVGDAVLESSDGQALVALGCAQ